MMGDGSLKSVEIDNDAFDADNKEMVQDLIVMAVNELQEKIEKAKEDINEKITGNRTGFGGF
jgi:DNA-binding protein YbaB